jgi:hypothetical protein
MLEKYFRWLISLIPLENRSGLDRYVERINSKWIK